MKVATINKAAGLLLTCTVANAISPDVFAELNPKLCPLLLQEPHFHVSADVFNNVGSSQPHLGSKRGYYGCLLAYLRPSSPQGLEADVRSLTKGRNRVVVVVSSNSTGLTGSALELGCKYRNLDLHVLNESGGDDAHVVSNSSSQCGPVKELNLGYTFIVGSTYPDDERLVAGFSRDVWDMMTRRLRFRMNLVYVAAYNDILKALMSGKIDASMALTGMEPVGFGIADHSPIVSQVGSTFIYKKPETAINYRTITMSFDTVTWACIFASSTMMCLVLGLAMRREIKDGKSDLFHVIGTVASTVSSETPPVRSFKLHYRPGAYVMLFCGLLGGGLLTHAYQSVLLTNLITDEYEDPINTWQKIIERNATLYSFEDSPIGLLISRSPNRDVRDAYNRQKEDVPLIELGKLMQGLQHDGSYVVIGIDDGLAGINHFAAASQEYFYTALFGHFISFRHPLKDGLDKNFRRMMEGGIHLKMSTDSQWGRRKAERDFYRAQGRMEKKLTVEHTFLLWPAFLVALAVAAVAFLIEVGRKALIGTFTRRESGEGLEASMARPVWLSPCA